uniref:C2H2-type domain-containing protein n=1 Tax=Oncorhynchus tshawytscha TaxID=74940 RepID=A0A8C8JQY3_ONCTS
VPPLPLPALRLMVPPLRLVSAAIWQTIQQSHVMDYGMLEEFVTMVTDVVPELLNDSQRAQLILGLRARLVLELCRSKPYHLGCPDLRQHLYSVFKADAEVGLSESSFLGLVQTLLKDPDEREHFFQDVFPVEFGSSYDAAIQKLMWQFLSRLEKLLPVSNFQQVLVEIQLYRGTMGLTLTQLTHIDVGFSSVGTKTFSLYKTDSETHVSSLNDRVECKRKEKASSVINDEEEDNSEFAETEEVEPDTSGMPDGKKHRTPSPPQMKSIDLSDTIISSMLHKPSVELQRIDTANLTLPLEPVRRNRGLCGRVLSRFSDMKKHMQTHKNGRTYQCRNCQKTFKHLYTFVPFTMCEAEFAQSSIDRRTCKVCGKIVHRIGYLSTHMKIHSANRHYSLGESKACSMCEESFMLTNLRTHYLDVHKFSGPFVCTHCPKSYKKFHSLIKHEMVHTGNLPLQCSQCPKRFIYNYDLVEHEKRHSDDRPCLCWECGKAFCTNIDLKQHMQNSHGEKSTECRFPCRHCGKPFRLSNSRANHEKTKHGGVRYPCTYCGKQFVCANALKRHDLIHTGERPFKCNHKSCDKAFRSRAELRIHTRYHTGERPFKCNVCGKGFVQANYLTTHYRTHTGEKPYSCSVCDKSFNYHDSLKRHMSTHSNEKPYKCLDCGKAFERKTLLNVHKRSCTSLLKC